MALALVAGQKNSGTSTTTSVTVNWGVGAPANGDLLIAFVENETGSSNTAPTIAGWTSDNNQNAGPNGSVLTMFSRIASAEGTSVTANCVGATSMALHIFDVSGNATSSPKDQTANTADTGLVTSKASGTTGTLAQPDEIAFVGVLTANSVTPVGWSNSFANGFDTTRLHTACLIVSASTALSSTFSWTTSRRSCGIIATYKAAAAAAGPLPYPSPYRQPPFRG